MDKTEIRETHDFKNVQSFSQLPFIRPAPVKEKPIRLFGIEFGGGAYSSAAGESESAETNLREEIKDSENGESEERRFECHYCCRNFPTSQALGGHQNAHKRERQHAKRVHLQSKAMAAQCGGSLSNRHMYGLLNYGRVGSAPMSAMNYPSWSSNSRFYGGGEQGSLYSQAPINGSPSAWWRIPAVQSNPSFNGDRSLHPLPLFSGEDLKVQAQVSLGTSSQSRYVYEAKPSVQDPVSLDLCL